MTQSTSRRNFLRHLSLGTVAVSSTVSLSSCGSDGPDAAVAFAHGVASGDPLSDRVVLWTRVATDATQDLDVDWFIAEDSNVSNIVRSGTVTTGAASDFTVKVDVTGLQANRRYYYRFQCKGIASPTGRTKTLGTGDLAQVKLAVFSCSNYPAGYFNVYGEAAKLDDLDAALHLGDYIYEYARDGYASRDAATLGRVSEPATEIVTLTDYRRRFAQYRSDPDLQAVHAALPFITVWDDHELANDTWREGAQNHDPALEGLFLARKRMAIQAYYEWMPIRAPEPNRPERIYRSFDFGNLLSLHMLDTRVIGRDQQLAYARYLGAGGRFDGAAFAADVGDPARQLMGSEQTGWLQRQLSGSKARWQVLGQQVLMARMNIPAPLVLGQISFGAYTALLAKAQRSPAELTAAEQQILAQPAIPYNLDAWDGYQAARETVLGMAKALDKNLVVLAGDTHNAWASDLQDRNGQAVGVEFGVSSVTSPGFEEVFPNEDPAAVAAGLVQVIGPLQYAETRSRGFLVLVVTPGETRAEYRYVSTVKSRSYAATPTRVLRTLPGAANRKLLLS